MSKPTYIYEAVKVDETTWMVHRYNSESSSTEFQDETLLRGCPLEWDQQDAIRDAVERGIWA